MKQGTKEFDQAMKEFDKIASKKFGLNISKEENRIYYAEKGMLIVYEDGKTNIMFEIFLHGIEVGKFIN